MAYSQTQKLNGVLNPVTSPRNRKDYILILLLTLIGLFGTLSCLSGKEHTTDKSITVQRMQIADF